MKIYFAGEPGGDKKQGEKRIIRVGGGISIDFFFLWKTSNNCNGDIS